jgi:carbamoyl-phosphate synthase large subunit
MSRSKKANLRHITVLVTGVGGPTGQGVLQSLHAIKNRPKIIASDISTAAAGYFWGDKSFVISHSSREENYLKCIKRICNKHKVRVIFPGSDGEARILANNSSKLNNINLATSSKIIWNSTGDKLLISRLCSKLKVSSPRTHPLSIPNAKKLLKKTCLPVTIKQRIGSGSRGIEIISNFKDIVKIVKKNKSNYIVQEYLPVENNEYTVGTYFDLFSNDHSNPIMIAYKRVLYHGNTISAETVNAKPFKKSIQKIGKYLKIKGYTNFQFIMKNNTPLLTDINSRFSSSTSMSLILGFNWIETYLSNLLYKVKPRGIDYKQGVVIVRYFKDIVLTRKPHHYDFIKH